MSTTWLSNLKTAGKARRDSVTFGEVAQIFTRQGYINQVSIAGVTDRQDKAMIGLGSHKKYVLAR